MFAIVPIADSGGYEGSEGAEYRQGKQQMLVSA